MLRNRIPRRGLAAACAGATLVFAAPASGATQLGEHFSTIQSCPSDTWVQSTSPGQSYAAPFAGVLTSWSFRDLADSALKLKVFRPQGGNSFTVVGESAPAQTASGLNTFPTRIAVQAGDLLGLYHASFGSSCQAGIVPPPIYTAHRVIGADQPPGTSATFTQFNNLRLNVAAILEPDADNDGFGDETQDNCPAVANTGQADGDGDGVGAACDDEVAPDTRITEQPPDKTKKKTATFVFSGTDTRAVASFQCSLDGAAFSPCTSPHTVKVRKGRHTFSVRATDAAGNVDASPVTDGWKVKRKKRK